MSKVALVIGGAGFVGSHLLKSLRDSGDYGTLVSADIAKPRFVVDGVTYKHVDVRQPLPDDLCPGVTEIYNLAAVHTTPGHEDWEYYWTNVLGATHACDFARRAAAKTMVFTSSISVYGPSEEPKTEESEPEPESAYGKSKLCAEKIHQNWLNEGAHRRLVIARPAVIYGHTERGNFTRLASLLSKGRFVYPGRKNTIKSSGYVDDLIGTFAFMLARQERFITYNFAHAGRYTAEDICRAFHTVAGYRVANVVIPIQPMLLGAWGFEMLNAVGLKTSINRPRIMKLNRSTNVIPKVLQDMAYNYRHTLEGSLRHWQSMSASGDFE